MGEWHLRKDVTVGNIVATIMLIGVFIGGYYGHEKRIALLEQAEINATVLRAEEIKDRERDIDRVCNRLDKMENLMLQILQAQSIQSHYETSNKE